MRKLTLLLLALFALSSCSKETFLFNSHLLKKSLPNQLSSGIFITTWQVPSDNLTLNLPLHPSFNYNFQVDWGDGSPVEAVTTASATHTYSAAGTYDVTMTGTYEYFGNFYCLVDPEVPTLEERLIDIKQWGGNKWKSMENSFCYNTSLEISATDAPNLTEVTNMSGMFMGAMRFNSPINHWNVSQVTNMLSLFENAYIFNQNLNNWNVSRVTNMSRMFTGASKFNQALNSWNVSNVTNMSYMFANATLFNQPLHSWNVSNVTNMRGMFLNAYLFNQPLNSWNVSKVSNMHAMFSSAYLFNQPLNNWDVSSVTDMSFMFASSILEGSTFDQPLNNWNVSSVTNMNSMFAYARSFNQPLNNWDVSSVTDMGSMFNEAASFNQDLRCWSVSIASVPANFRINAPVHMKSPNFGAGPGSCIIPPAQTPITIADSTAFVTTWKITANGESLTLPLSGAGYNFTIDWGDGTLPDTIVSAVASHTYASAGEYHVTMTGVIPSFGYQGSCTSDGGRSRLIDIKQWGTNIWQSLGFCKATNLRVSALDAPDLTGTLSLSEFFYHAHHFNSNINHWNVSNIRNFRAIFSGAYLFNGPLANWNLSSATDVDSMLNRAYSFNQPIELWDMTNLTSIGGILYGALSFNQSLASWDVSNITNMGLSLGSTLSFNQPLNSWDVSNVTHMGMMFLGAYSFNQPLPDWNVANVTNMAYMFSGAISNQQNLSCWNVINFVSEPLFFRSSNSLLTPPLWGTDGTGGTCSQ